MSKPNEERDIYYIPPNFLASGRLFGGMIRARNAIEACVLVLLTGIPIIKLPMSLTVRITPDEVLRLPPDQVLIFIRGQKVMRAKRFDYSLHPDYKKLKSRKAILHEPDWKSSQASSVSASGVSSPSVTAAIPAEKANVGSQKKPPGKPARSTTRKVVNADELF